MSNSAVIEKYTTYVRALAQGHESALALLADQSDTESLRRRARHLLDLGRNAEVLTLLQDLPLDLEWSEQLLRAQARSGMLDCALGTICWTRENGTTTHAARAALIASVEALETLSNRSTNFNEIPLLNLSSVDQHTLGFARDLCTPLARGFADAGIAKSTLERLIVITALRAAAMLGDMANMKGLAAIAEQSKPFPAELAYLANAGLIEAKREWSARIRQDHTSIDAHVIGAVLDARHFDQARSAFEHLLTLVDSPHTATESQNLYFGLREISQFLGEPEIRRIDDLAPRLLAGSRELLAFTRAEAALSAGQTAIAQNLLEDWRDPKNPVWVQLSAQLLMQKRELSQAIELLTDFGNEHASPATLQLLAQAAFRAERYEVARSALEDLLVMRPTDDSARRNLGLVLVRLEDKLSALPILKSLVEHDPENEQDLVLYAQCLTDLDQTEVAISELSRFLSQTPTSLPVRILLASALQAVGRPEDGFRTLNVAEPEYRDDPHFQFAHFEAASRAGHDLDAHNAMQALVSLRQAGKISEKALWKADVSDVIEYSRSFHENLEKAHLEYLQGKLPWLALAELERKPVLWAWFLRTQKMSWLAESQDSIAQYSTYCTNSFTVLRDPSGSRLVDIEAAPLDSTIALDISALVTVWECGLFDELCSSYEKILLPSLYLERAMADRPRLLPHQLSQSTTAHDIQTALDSKRISVSAAAEDSEDKQLSEYSDVALWRLANVKDALQNAGLLSRDAAERLSRISQKSASAAVLNRHTSLLIELHTLRTLASEGLLELLADNWNIIISSDSRDEINSTVRAFERQQKIFSSHDQLWRRIRSSPQITLVPTRGILSEGAADAAPRTPFLGMALALESQMPLLVDDRFAQQFVLNAQGLSQHAAFGTDQLLLALMAAKRIDGGKAAKAYLDLMEKRYKFLVPPAELILEIANLYPDAVPNHGLKIVARYLHACMRDPGLYAAAEPVVPPVSVSLRLYTRWTMELAHFAAAVWGDTKYSDTFAESMTKWISREALPAPAQTLGAMPTAVGSWDTRQHFLKYFATASLAFRDNDRMSRGFSVVREALQFTDEEYADCLIEVISHVRA